MKIKRNGSVCRFGILLVMVLFTDAFSLCRAQSKLTLQDAVTRALGSRASLNAEAGRITSAQGRERQSALIPNPSFQFENQNLRPGQTYTRDVDTYAYLTQPLDILGKRKQRINSAAKEVSSAQAQYELARREVMQSVKQSYWAARGPSGPPVHAYNSKKRWGRRTSPSWT